MLLSLSNFIKVQTSRKIGSESLTEGCPLPGPLRSHICVLNCCMQSSSSQLRLYLLSVEPDLVNL